MAKSIKKLTKDDQQLIRLRLFLDECGLRRYRFTVRELKEILKTLSKEK